jgi:hypothetical protein
MNTWLFYTFTQHIGTLNWCFMSVNSPLTSGLRGWPTGEIPWPTGQVLCQFGPRHTCLHEKGKAKAVEKVSGGQTTYPAGHQLVSYRLNQVSNPSLDPCKYPTTNGNQNTHHILSVVARPSPVGRVPRL